MRSKKNYLRKGFLKKYRKGKDNEIKFLPLKNGFLRLEYEDQGVLSIVSYVLSKAKNALSIGKRLELSLDQDYNNDTATYIEEMGISGFQWSNGEVFWGHTFDDDSPPTGVRKIILDEWIDECIKMMINPSKEF